MTVACAGKEGTLALDDVYTAGAIVARILDLGPEVELDEAAIVALRVAQGQPDAVQALAESQSALVLAGVGLSGDVPWCAATPRTPAGAGRSGRAAGRWELGVGRTHHPHFNPLPSRDV